MRNIAFFGMRADTNRGACRGYGTVELMATILLLAVLSGLAWPAMGQLMVRHRLAAISNDMLALLRVARHEAMHRGTRVTLCRTHNPDAPLPACAGPGASWGEGIMVFVDTGINTPPQPADAAAILRIGDAIDPRYRINRKGLTSPSLSFGANGRLKSGTFGVSFRIAPAESNDGTERWICVATTGRMRVTPLGCE